MKVNNANKMDNALLVSVIIPVFNCSLYLKEAINSVISQSYSNLEIIIIDDGSNDGSGEICDQYSKMDERIRVFHQLNQGLSSSRNFGLDIANGDLIAFMDADDAYHPDFVKTLINSMISEKTDISICKYTIHRTKQKIMGSKIEGVFPSIEPGIYNHSVAMRSLAEFLITSAVWNKLYKKSLWEDIRFPNGHVHEDIDTLFRVLDKCKRISVVKNPLYLYRKHPDSLSCSITEEYISDYYIASSHFIEFIKNNIPDLFSSNDLIIREQSQLQHLIRYSLYYLNSNYSVDSSFYIGLRHQIKNLYSEIGSKNSSFRIKIEYLFAVIFPSSITKRLVRFCYKFKRSLTK